MQNFVDFDEYAGAGRDFTSNPMGFIERTRHNGTFDDELAEDGNYPETYYEQAAMLSAEPRHRKRYGPVRLRHHNGKHYVVSGAMVQSLVPSFKTAAMGVDSKTGDIMDKYPAVSEDRTVHTTPMWNVSAGQSPTSMRIEAPSEDAGTFDQKVTNTDMHVGAIMENEGQSFMTIHGVGSLIKASLQSARDAGSALGVFSYKAPVSTKELSVAAKMAPVLETIQDTCHKMPVGTEMLAPINKKLEVPVHTVIEEKPATPIASTIKVGSEMKGTESTPVTNAIAHIQNMKVSAAIKEEMTNAISGAYAAKRFNNVPLMKVEAFSGKGMVHQQTGAVHLPNAESNAVHEYKEDTIPTSYVGIKMGDESVVCHVTEGVENAGMTTIRTCMSPQSETPYTKVTNMHGKSMNAFRVSAPIKEGERASGKSLTFIHSN